MNGRPRGSKTQILAKNDPKYLYYVKILPVWPIDSIIAHNSHKNTTLMPYIQYQFIFLTYVVTFNTINARWGPKKHF